MSRLVSISSRVLAPVLALPFLAACPTAECQYYNDCPPSEYCEEGVCKEVPGEECEAGGESPYFLAQGFLASADHWTCNLPPVATDDAPHVTGFTGPTTLVNGGSTRILLDYVGPPDLTGQRMLFGVRGADTYHFVQLAADQPKPMPVDLFIAPTAVGGSFDLTVAFDDGSGTPDRPSLGPEYRIPMRVINVAGGDIQVSLTWETGTDVDLYIEDPLGNVIFYGEPESASGGKLDLDSNAACNQPFNQNENIYWPTNAAPSGHYKVWVNLWSGCGYVDNTTWRMTKVIRRTEFQTLDGVLFPTDEAPEFAPGVPGASGFVRNPDFEFDF